MALLPCPCCGQIPTTRRTTPVTEEQAARGYLFCRARGFTREQLLSETYRETLDFTAPGLRDFIAAMPDEKPRCN
ncbi:MAG: hypothetical protein ABSC06_22430 [Rhodopila sp.]|jgi:hypothetical protein